MKAIKILTIIASALTVAAAGVAVAAGILSLVKIAKQKDYMEPDADPFRE